MKIRPKFNCWNCHRDYSLLREVNEGLKLLVQCPYCGAEGEVDLAQFYRTEAVDILRSGRAGPLNLELLDLPDLLPTKPPDSDG
jgi:DNA-directed RNA polymerase subunit RPC12/RpoP